MDEADAWGCPVRILLSGMVLTVIPLLGNRARLCLGRAEEKWYVNEW